MSEKEKKRLYEEEKITENQIHASYERIMGLKKSIGIIK